MMNARPIRVLVVEDDEDSYVLARELLLEVAESTYEVDWARTLESAVLMLASGGFDICLADYHLGASTGAELIGRTSANGVETPVVVYSGATEVVDLPSIRAGAGDFLPKPRLSTGALHRSLQYTLERHRLLLQLRQQQRELQASEARLRAVVDNTIDGLVVVGNDGEILFANPEARKSWGAQLGTLVRAYLATPTEQGIVELTVPQLEGEDRVAEARGASLDWQQMAASIVSIHDITARRHLEDQLRQAQKMEAVGRLTGGIAHDLNNILTIIISTVALLEDAVDDQGRSDVHLIRQAAGRGAELIRKLLAFSRRQALAVRAVEPADLVAEFEQLARRLLPDSVAIETSLGPGLGPVRADPGAVMQILLNLATNARDSMPLGGQLRLSAERHFRSADTPVTGALRGEFVRFTVSDIGCGMSAEVLDHVLEPFFTTKGIGEGSGLGLPMVYGLVMQHHGFIEIRSEVGLGTAVSVHIPVADAHPGDALLPAARRGVETILLVEDEADLRHNARRLLEREGYRVEEASNGAEALAILESVTNTFHLIVSDILMPVLGGREFVRVARARWPDLPVLLTSGHAPAPGGPEPDLDRLPVLAKPWQAGDLLATVRSILDASRHMQTPSGPDRTVE